MAFLSTIAWLMIRRQTSPDNSFAAKHSLCMICAARGNEAVVNERLNARFCGCQLMRRAVKTAEAQKRPANSIGMY